MFQLKYIHFVYSYVVYIAFASCLRREDQFVVFFPTKSTRTCFFYFFFFARGHVAVMVNEPFSDLPFFW